MVYTGNAPSRNHCLGGASLLCNESDLFTYVFPLRSWSLTDLAGGRGRDCCGTGASRSRCMALGRPELRAVGSERPLRWDIESVRFFVPFADFDGDAPLPTSSAAE